MFGRCILLAAFVFGTHLEASTPKDLGDVLRIQQQVQHALEACQRATVGIARGGSGVIISADGIVLTAAHVSMIPERKMLIQLHDGRETRAIALGLNAPSDAGIAKIIEPGPWPFVPMARGKKREAGDWCFALGHPGGFDLERGSVLRVGRLIGEHALVMRTDCHLIGGDSGGPLFDLQGEVIGIHSRVSEQIDDNYHVPIEAFHRHWELFMERKAIQLGSDDLGGFLGIHSKLTLDGAMIQEILPETPAAKSPLKVGDVITSVAKVRIFHPQELGWAVARWKPESTLAFDILRDNKPRQMQITIGQRSRR